jgi:hypothetical protein
MILRGNKRIDYPCSGRYSGTYTVEAPYDYLYQAGKIYIQVAYESLVTKLLAALKAKYYDSHGNWLEMKLGHSLNDWVVFHNVSTIMVKYSP